LGYWRVYVNEDEPDIEAECFLVLANLTDEAQTVTLDLAAHQGKTPVDVLTSDSWPAITGEPYPVTLAPYAYAWLKLT